MVKKKAAFTFMETVSEDLQLPSKTDRNTPRHNENTNHGREESSRSATVAVKGTWPR